MKQKKVPMLIAPPKPEQRIYNPFGSFEANTKIDFEKTDDSLFTINFPIMKNTQPPYNYRANCKEFSTGRSFHVDFQMPTVPTDQEVINICVEMYKRNMQTQKEILNIKA